MNLYTSADKSVKIRTFLQEGDLLAILNVGAYGFSMSSQYNTRPRAAEVMINKKDSKIIRQRETINDLIKDKKLLRGLNENFY